MYDHPASLPKQEVVRQCDLPQIHSEFVDVNERTCSIISSIRGAISRIKPIPEKENLPKERPNPIDEGSSSFVAGMNVHLRFARKNADDLDDILRHLNSLV